jgi:hypothetical protein
MRFSERNLPTRFWVEAGLAAVTGVLFVVTLFWHDWMEAFGFDPDHGDGSAEWVAVVVLAVLSLALSAFARIEWRRAQPAT